MGDVELPPWAHGSPERFLAVHRAALEAPFVSANLHHWIGACRHAAWWWAGRRAEFVKSSMRIARDHHAWCAGQGNSDSMARTKY